MMMGKLPQQNLLTHLFDMRNIVKLLAIIILASFSASCMKEEISEPKPVVTEGEGMLLVNFGPQENSVVVTKATLSETNESQIFNFYVFVFDSNGSKVAGVFFDSSNQKATKDEVTSATDNCWYVNNAVNSGDVTSGSVLVKTSAGTNMTVYLIANLDADMVRVSSDLLGASISTEADLKNFNVYMNQKIVNRNGYFPMSGKISGVTISGGTSSDEMVRTVITDTMLLRRMDAKVRFIFKQGTRPDASGQVVKSFVAKQWKVVNVPRTAYVLGYAARGISDERGRDYTSVPPTTPESDYSKYAKDFFDTDFVNFEDFPSTGTSEFSFYMLENRQIPKKTLTAYQDRSRQVKTSTGLNESCPVSYSVDGVQYSRDMRVFEYANDFSTYVVVTGYVEMELTNDSAGQVLGGDVQYIIHLGNWSASIDNSTGNTGDGKDTYSGFDNFNTERNTSYTYTVTVNSVNSIRVEVETSKGEVSDVEERQPGATGQISIAKETIALCDCHYESKTINFHLANFFQNGNVSSDNCIVDELTWAVKTPFGEGEPQKEGDIDITTGLDYKWVRFRLNKRDDDGNFYTDKRRKYTPRSFQTYNTLRTAEENAEDDGTPGLSGYHNDGSMDIKELVTYIKTQVHKFIENRETSDFDHKTSTDMSEPNICLTAFIDEYYYTENPLTGQKSSDLWKQFVNQGDRKLHILCNSEKSKDLESSSTGSVTTIQQHSIQCIYNTDQSYTALQTAWGVERTDEFESKGWNYWSTNSGTYENRGNVSNVNGLFNTCKEWGVSPKSATDNTFTTGVEWGTFMNYEVSNDTPQLNDTYAYMRYSCMTRNRDNNGDGKIDRNEVRWYLASVNQLVGMFVGDGLLDSDTKLYNRTPEQKKSSSSSDWQQHIVSSTSIFADDSRSDGSWGGDYAYVRNSNDPTMVWAEEGISTSHTYHNWGDQRGTSIRCVRNLGFIDGNSEETYDIDKMYDDYIQMETKTDSDNKTYYVFTATHLNAQALRYYTSKELIFSDERSLENRLYKKFQTYPGGAQSLSGVLFADYNTAVNEGVAAGTGNKYCPEGYRTPSQIEAAVMKYYLPVAEVKNTMSRTYWSFGPYGTTVHSNYKKGFVVNGGNVTVGGGEYPGYVRCVRDIRTN